MSDFIHPSRVTPTGPGHVTGIQPRIDKLRQIVANHQAGLIDGFWVDVTTANMLVTVHDALRPDLQPKFETVPFMRLVDFGWKHVRVG